MNNDTVVNSKTIFYELVNLLTDFSIEVHLINFFISPVKTQIMNSNRRPMIWYLGVGAVNDLFNLIDRYKL